jgi:predicted metal-dependent phosphoesterase TrpH
MNTAYVDLHIHSTCSDGHRSPEEVVTLAAAAGLVAVALADHDNIDGISRAVTAAADHGLEVIPAVELSSQWHDYTDMHLLGYGFDYHDHRLIAELDQFQQFRADRNLKIIEAVNLKLAGEGRSPIDPHAVRQLAGGSIGRPHIAQALRQAGHVTGNEEAFVRYLVPCNVPKHYFPADRAIRLIHASGGIAVLAHPPYVTRDRRRLEALVGELVELGLDGIEAYNNGSGLEETDWLIRLAGSYQLAVTGGSDYHGDEGSNIEIGRGLRGIRVPYDCVEQIKATLQRRGHPASWSGSGVAPEPMSAVPPRP